MKKYKIVKKIIEKEELVKVTCDFCGSEFNESFIHYKAFGKINITSGYSSKYDVRTFEGEICDSCFEKLFKSKLRGHMWN